MTKTVKDVVEKYSKGFPARRYLCEPFAKEILEAVKEEMKRELHPPKGCEIPPAEHVLDEIIESL